MKREQGSSNPRRNWKARLTILVSLVALTMSALCFSPHNQAGRLVFESVAQAQSCSITEPPAVPTAVIFTAFFGEKVMFKLAVPAIPGDSLTYALESSPTQGGPTAANLNSNTGILLYQPLVMNTVNFTIKVTNCKGLSASTPITLNVLPNPNRPNIIGPQFSSKKGLFIDGAESNIRTGATIRIRPGSGAVETFLLEFQPKRNQWAVRARASVQSTPGKKNIRDVIQPGVDTQLVVVSDDIPSAPFVFRR